MPAPSRRRSAPSSSSAPGIKGDDCGQLSLSEVAFIKSKKDNTN